MREFRFEHTSAPWIRYNSYEYKTGSDNNLYITVSKDAKPEMYHPMLEAEQLVIDAILPKNHFIKEESLPTDEYFSYFYPFDKSDNR